MAFLVATMSLPAVYRPNEYAWTTTAGTPHAHAKKLCSEDRQPNLQTHRVLYATCKGIKVNFGDKIPLNKY